MEVDSEVVGTVDAEARSASTAEQGTANSGTLGCVGLIRWDDMQTLAGLVQRRNVRAMVVSE